MDVCHRIMRYMFLVACDFACNNPRLKDKFASRNRRCVFLGYPSGKKGWRVYDLETYETFVSRDVVFCEDHFPFEPWNREAHPAQMSYGSPIWYSVMNTSPMKKFSVQPNSGSWRTKGTVTPCQTHYCGLESMEPEGVVR